MDVVEVRPTLTSSPEPFDFALRQIAERLSYMRWIERLGSNAERLRGQYDTDEDRHNDWLDACAFLALKILEGSELRLAHLQPASYRHLEDVWLRRVKQLKAHYVWKTRSAGSPESDYHRASGEIRRLLLERPRADVEEFQRVKSYIEDNFLGSDGRLDDRKPRAHELVSKKAHRIWQISGNPHHDPLRAQVLNWYRARLYVTMFYENVIPAITRDDELSTLNVLKAFEFSKAPENSYFVINSFEAAIAIEFLNKVVIRDVLKHPDRYAFSMVPVIDWPMPFITPVACDGRFRYDEDDRQICYDGRMTEAQRTELISSLESAHHRAAVEQLYRQSQLKPFEAMIL